MTKLAQNLEPSSNDYALLMNAFTRFLRTSGAYEGIFQKNKNTLVPIFRARETKSANVAFAAIKAMESAVTFHVNAPMASACTFDRRSSPRSSDLESEMHKILLFL